MLLHLVATAILVIACSEEGAVSPTATRTATPMESPEPTAPLLTPGSLSVYDSSSNLLVQGRASMRACVQVLDGGTTVEKATAAVEAALRAARDDPEWPEDFGIPAVDFGCPLPPVALDATIPSAVDRTICRELVGPYLVYVFIGDSSQFAERFPQEIVEAGGEGRRWAAQEYISGPERPCDHQVAEAWYLTLGDLQDSALLESYIFNIFNIRDLGR